MTRTIDDQIRTFYAEQSLSTETLDRLRSLVEKPESPRRAESVRMWQTLAIAATVAVAFLAGVLFVSESPTTTPAPAASTAAGTPDVSNRIAQEVAMRHHKCTHKDFTASELAELAPMMTNLDFEITTPDGVDMTRLTLQGAHYCVVNGQLALHATYIDSNGNAVSLLETRSSPQLESMRHAMHEIEDVEVEMWRKGEVIIAMARPMAGVA
jgi:hypothetical protein